MPLLLFFEDVDCKYDTKNIQAYSEPHNFKILGNKMNEKASSKIILKDVNMWRT